MDIASNIKLIIFDLDGVLVDAKKIHYEALNKALEEVDPCYIITEAEHICKFDGLKTKEKLRLLTKDKHLPVNLYTQIWNRKQNITLDKISQLTKDDKLVSIFKNLRQKNIKIACCSNSIRQSVVNMLQQIGIFEYFHLLISNEDVKNSKPHPEMYWKAMIIFSSLPEETLIVEDSPYGLLAAHRSNASLLRVSNPTDLTLEKIEDQLYISHVMTNKWKDKKMNVLIPMSGAGSRFEKTGFVFPKPLIEVFGKPMIHLVTQNINVEAHFIFIVQKSHREKYNLDALLNLIEKNCTIIEVDGLTEGAACSTLLAKNYINNENPLLIANADQFIEWNSNEFFYKMQEQDVDAGILTFSSTHPKWSYAKVDEQGYVVEVAEKKPISDMATVGIYYWKHGKDYVKYAESMIQQNIRINNEFYVCPVFNEAIKDNKKITTFNVEKMWGIGTPEDLEYFTLNNTHLI